MVLRFHLKAQRSFKRCAAKQVTWDPRCETEFGNIMQHLHIMRPDAADDAVRAGRDLDQRYVSNHWHHSILARDWFSMRAAGGVVGQFIKPVLDFIVDAALEDIRKLVRRAPV